MSRGSKSKEENLELSLMTELATLNLRSQRPYSDSFSSAIPLQRSYGATNSQLTFANTKLLKHKVATGETLQGISIRYGVPLEQIRRLNRLWTNDSIFFKDCLLIPLPSSSEFYDVENEAESEDTSNPSSPTSAITSSAEVVEENSKSDSGVDAETKSETASASRSSEEPERDDDGLPDTCSNFLKAFDDKMSTFKSKVLKLRDQDGAQPPVPEVAYDSYQAGKSSPTKHYSKLLQDI